MMKKNDVEIKEPKETMESNSDNYLGLDPDEQEMNGLYGIAETEYEDRLHDVEK